MRFLLTLCCTSKINHVVTHTHKSNRQQIYINLIDFKSPEVSDRIMFTRAARITTIKRLFVDFTCDISHRLCAICRSVRLIFLCTKCGGFACSFTSKWEKMRTLLNCESIAAETVLLLSKRIWEVYTV